MDTTWSKPFTSYRHILTLCLHPKTWNHAELIKDMTIPLGIFLIIKITK